MPRFGLVLPQLFSLPSGTGKGIKLKSPMFLKDSSYMEDEITLTEVRKYLQTSGSPTSYSEHIQQAMSSWFLNISEDAGSTVSRKPITVLYHLYGIFSYIERFYFIFLCYFPACVCFLLLSICTAEKFDSVFFSFLHEVLLGLPCLVGLP